MRERFINCEEHNLFEGVNLTKLRFWYILQSNLDIDFHILHLSFLLIKFSEASYILEINN
jgi:hypothetical protein